MKSPIWWKGYLQRMTSDGNVLGQLWPERGKALSCHHSSTFPTLLRFRSPSDSCELCRSLRCLRFPNSHYVTDPVFCKVASKFPDLEELDISGCMNLSKLTLQEVGESCKGLFRLERKGLLWLDRSWSDHTIQDDEEALIIAKTMPHLRHLEISDTLITNEGLLALLEGCTGLEYLDVRGCRNLSIEKETAEKCYKLKYFHITDDWDDFSDYSYYYEEVDGLSDDIMEFYDPYDPYNYFNEINWWLSSGS